MDGRGESFAYVGAGGAYPVKDKVSVVGRVFGGLLGYEFSSGGRTLEADLRMLTLTAGVKLDRGRYTLVGTAGPDIRRTERDTASGGKEESSETGAVIQAEGYFDLEGGRRGELMASFSSVDEFFWARGRLKGAGYRTGGVKFYPGVEAVGMGNTDYTAAQAGVLVELAGEGSTLSVTLKAGVKDTSTAGATGYGGIELYKGF